MLFFFLTYIFVYGKIKVNRIRGIFLIPPLLSVKVLFGFDWRTGMMCRNIRNFVLLALCAFAYDLKAQDMLCEPLPDCTDLGYELSVTCSDSEALACPYDVRYKKCANPSCETLGYTKTDKTKWCKNIIACPTDAAYTLCAEGCGKICPSESSIDPNCQYGRTSVDTDGCGNTCYRCNICPEDEQTGYTTAALSCTSAQYVVSRLTSHCGAEGERYICADCPTGMKASYLNSYKCVCDSTQGYTTSCPANAVCQGTSSIFGPCQQLSGCQDGYTWNGSSCEKDCTATCTSEGYKDQESGVDTYCYNLLTPEVCCTTCYTEGAKKSCSELSTVSVTYFNSSSDAAGANSCYKYASQTVCAGTCYTRGVAKTCNELNSSWYDQTTASQNGTYNISPVTSACRDDCYKRDGEACNDVCGEGVFASYTYTTEAEASANGGYNIDQKQKCDNNYCYSRGTPKTCPIGYATTASECGDNFVLGSSTNGKSGDSTCYDCKCDSSHCGANCETYITTCDDSYKWTKDNRPSHSHWPTDATPCIPVNAATCTKEDELYDDFECDTNYKKNTAGTGCEKICTPACPTGWSATPVSKSYDCQTVETESKSNGCGGTITCYQVSNAGCKTSCNDYGYSDARDVQGYSCTKVPEFTNEIGQELSCYDKCSPCATATAYCSHPSKVGNYQIPYTAGTEMCPVTCYCSATCSDHGYKNSATGNYTHPIEQTFCGSVNKTCYVSTTCEDHGYKSSPQAGYVAYTMNFYGVQKTCYVRTVCDEINPKFSGTQTPYYDTRINVPIPNGSTLTCYYHTSNSGGGDACFDPSEVGVCCEFTGLNFWCSRNQ